VHELHNTQATCLETGETVAIKKVLQDKRFKNRELQIMQLLEHCNVIKHKHCFYSTTAEHEVRLLSRWKEKAAGATAAVQ
jgi:hypothetical protein